MKTVKHYKHLQPTRLFLGTKDMDVNKAEHIIQKSAEIFEKQFNYLRSIY